MTSLALCFLVHQVYFWTRQREIVRLYCSSLQGIATCHRDWDATLSVASVFGTTISCDLFCFWISSPLQTSSITWITFLDRTPLNQRQYLALCPDSPALWLSSLVPTVSSRNSGLPCQYGGLSSIQRSIVRTRSVDIWFLPTLAHIVAVVPMPSFLGWFHSFQLHDSSRRWWIRG